MVKDTALDTTVPTGGSNLRFLALHPGSAMRRGLGANHPVLSHTLPVYLPQISPGTHLELGRLWLSLQSHAIDPRPKLNNWVHWDLNPRHLRHRILNPAHQSSFPKREV